MAADKNPSLSFISAKNGNLKTELRLIIAGWTNNGKVELFGDYLSSSSTYNIERAVEYGSQLGQRGKLLLSQ